jgi:YD repeat-containing protein
MQTGVSSPARRPSGRAAGGSHRTAGSADAGGSAASGIYAFEYADGDLLRGVTDPAGRRWRVDHDDEGLVAAVTRPDGNVRRYARRRVEGGVEVLSIPAPDSRRFLGTAIAMREAQRSIKRSRGECSPAAGRHGTVA